MPEISANMFLQAASDGTIDVVRNYIRENTHQLAALNINQTDQFNLPAIVLATLNGHINVVAELLHAGADVNANIEKGATALYAACWKGDVEIVKLLLTVSGIAFHVNPAIRNDPLTLAAKLGHHEIVKLLIDSGAPIHNYKQLVNRLQLPGADYMASLLDRQQPSHPDTINDSLLRTNRGKSNDSRECFEDLNKRGLIHHYFSWNGKTTGIMNGVTLFGSNKHGAMKRVFVKSYRSGCFGNGGPLDELIDYAGFTILKKCGVRAPKVKLKGAAADNAHGLPECVYLFSTDIAQANSKHPARKYLFYEAYSLPVGVELFNGCLQARVDLFPELARDADHNATQQKFKYPLDIPGSTRALLLAVILGLTDLHQGNTGFVVSNENGIVKTKLGIVDFCNSVVAVDIPYGSTLMDFINKYNDKLCYELRDFQKLAKESDYINAFNRIENEFIPACDEVIANVKLMPFETDVRKEYFESRVAIWKRNFANVKKLVDDARNKLALDAGGVTDNRVIGEKSNQSPVELDAIGRPEKRTRVK